MKYGCANHEGAVEKCTKTGFFSSSHRVCGHLLSSGEAGKAGVAVGRLSPWAGTTPAGTEHWRSVDIGKVRFSPKCSLYSRNCFSPSLGLLLILGMLNSPVVALEVG